MLLSDVLDAPVQFARTVPVNPRRDARSLRLRSADVRPVTNLQRISVAAAYSAFAEECVMQSAVRRPQQPVCADSPDHPVNVLILRAPPGRARYSILSKRVRDMAYSMGG